MPVEAIFRFQAVPCRIKGTLYGSLFAGNYKVSQNVPAPASQEGDIIVEATPEQVAAAKLSLEKAGFIVQANQVAAILAAMVVKTWAGAPVAIAEKLADFNSTQLKNNLADMLYYQDGLDGVYDGMASNYHVFDGFENRHYGPGGRTPKKPEGDPDIHNKLEDGGDFGPLEYVDFKDQWSFDGHSIMMDSMHLV